MDGSINATTLDAPLDTKPRLGRFEGKNAFREDSSMSSLTGIAFQSAATYTFVKEIGRGGMGVVYLAEKHSEGVSDLVVLKTIRTLRDHQVAMLKRGSQHRGDPAP